MLKDQKVITINCPWCDWKGTIPQYLMHFDKCGADLSDEDVMKIILEDGSCEVFPFSTCPKCFQKELLEKARR